MEIGDKLRYFRNKANYSQEDVAQLLGITRRAYLNIEGNQNKTIAIEQVKKLSEIFEVDWLELLSYGEGERVEQQNVENKDCVINLIKSVEYYLGADQAVLAVEIKHLKNTIEQLETENAYLKNLLNRLTENGMD